MSSGSEWPAQASMAELQNSVASWSILGEIIQGMLRSMLWRAYELGQADD